jgi:transcriptional regulator with GAF, ATPase, and Fis domain
MLTSPWRTALSSRSAPDVPDRVHDAIESDHDTTGRPTGPTIIGTSAAIQRAFDQARLVANTSATVLLLGETGVGKEVFAQAIHAASSRRCRTMISVSFAAIPSPLLESELFGCERGAFTDAMTSRIGRFEAAHGSTLFLDEIGELPAESQVKLLRVLETQAVDRLGGRAPKTVDVRIVAATNRDLGEAVDRGEFREDLFYRLNVFPITIPPLRKRIEDVPALAQAFVDELSRAFGKRVAAISRESLAELMRYDWPGNVRELRNAIERAMIVSTGPVLRVSPTAATKHPLPSRTLTLAEIQVQHIRRVLDGCSWRIRGHGGAAQRLGVKPTTLESRMSRLGISRSTTG